MAEITVDRDEFIEACEAIGVRPYLDYSGRGMSGATCVGIVGNDDDLVTFSDEVMVAFGDRASWSQLCRDSMGYDTIHYWPNVQASPAGQ